MKGFKDIPVRFFLFELDEDNQDVSDIEVDELEFQEVEGDIFYERNTVRENGCSQICLTKYPRGLMERKQK